MKRIEYINSDDENVLKKIVAIQHLIDSKKRFSNNNELLLYGGGIHTEFMLKYLDFNGYNVHVCDKDPEKVGKLISDICIEDAHTISFEKYDCVIVSSFKFQKEIVDELTSKIDKSKMVVLYDKETQPFYLNEVELDINLMKDLFHGENELAVDFKYNAWKYENAGELYDQRVERDFFEKIEKNLYMKYINYQDLVLDIGAGTGRLSLEVAKVAKKVTAVDTSESMLNQIKIKNKEINTVLVKNEKVPFEDESFDKVVSCDAMIHFSKWPDFLKEHVRVLKRGGYIIYNMMNSDSLLNISDNPICAGSYIGGYGDYYATINKRKLMEECEKIGGVELVNMIPYCWLFQNEALYGNYTRNEMFLLSKMYYSLMKDKKNGLIIEKIENDIISKLPEDYCTKNICVFRKK